MDNQKIISKFCFKFLFDLLSDNTKFPLIKRNSLIINVFQRYVGRLELARSKEESAQAVQQGRHLSYYVHFPLRYPIPTLSGIWFNGEQYCSGPDGKYL